MKGLHDCSSYNKGVVQELRWVSMVMSLDWIIVSDLLMVFTGGDLCRAQCYPLQAVQVEEVVNLCKQMWSHFLLNIFTK